MLFQRIGVRLLPALGLLAAGPAFSLGFGSVAPTTVLGQPLDLKVPLRLEPGESLTTACVRAEVASGDHRLQPDRVQARVDEVPGQTPVLRVATEAAMDEPVVSVTVSLGCPARLTRQFVLLADPPMVSPQLPVVASSAPMAPVDAAPTTASGVAPRTALPPASPASAPPAVLSGPLAPREAARQAVGATPRARRPGSRAGGATSPRPSRTAPAVRRAGAATAPAGRSAAPAARLRLDAPVLPPTTPPPAAAQAEALAAAASAAVAQAAASAASAVAEAASAAAQAQDRVAALEKAIAQLQADRATDRETLAQLRSRARDSEAAARWMPYLAALTALLAVLALWMGVRLRALQREREKAWWSAAAQAAQAASKQAPEGAASATMPGPTTADAPLSTAGFEPSRPGSSGITTAGVFSPEPDTVPPAMQRTEVLPVGWRDEDPGSRDVSVEELIDLEQQAEFFIVLGQEEAAVDLLVDHLRSTGGGSPLPYLKLLEIYRRRGDREAYERTRARFNHRFNAYAPDWDDDVQGGRSLEDYPVIVARLQMAWPSPLDAMAELESLLFRKSRGELFDMPAYRDVLFLYALARDLLDREPLETGKVDVLLPLVDPELQTQPMSIERGGEGPPTGLSQLDDQPTQPVDLDLTRPVVSDSIFGEPTQPLRRM